MPPPRVSVLLPTRNAASTIGAALDSVRHQTFADWELLVVDDGSTDDSAAIARHQAREDPRLRCLSQPPLGLVAALNHGLQHARADTIARMDADDLSHPERLQLQLATLDHDPSLGLVSCRVGYVGCRHHQSGYALHVDWANTLLTPEAIRLNRFIESPVPHPSVMFRRALIERHGGYQDGPFPEDYELWLRWLEAGVIMAKVDRELLLWHDPPDRLSRTHPRYAPAAFYQVKAAYLAQQLRRTIGQRQLWVWGAGRLTRRRAELLEAHHLDIHGFIDIDTRKTHQRPGARPVLLPHELPPPTQALIAVYVGRRGAREAIRAALTARHYVEGHDFWIAA